MSGPMPPAGTAPRPGPGSMPPAVAVLPPVTVTVAMVVRLGRWRLVHAHRLRRHDHHALRRRRDDHASRRRRCDDHPRRRANHDHRGLLDDHPRRWWGRRRVDDRPTYHHLHRLRRSGAGGCKQSTDESQRQAGSAQRPQPPVARGANRSKYLGLLPSLPKEQLRWHGFQSVLP